MRHRLVYLVLALVSALAFTAVTAPVANAGGAAPTAATYVALGDSYPAGDFLAPGQDSYPKLLAGDGGVTLLANSGMSVANLLAALPSATPDPQVKWVTLTIGANDTDWVNQLSGCVQAGAACDYLQVIKNLNKQVDKVTPKLPKLIKQVHRVYPKATIFWSGYVRPFGPSSLKMTCEVPFGGDVVGVPALMGVAIDATVVNLNTRIAAAVLVEHLKKTPVKYVAADSAFAGHRYCNADPWLTMLHPNADGQQAYAKAFRAAGMPTG